MDPDKLHGNVTPPASFLEYLISGTYQRGPNSLLRRKRVVGNAEGVGSTRGFQFVLPNAPPRERDSHSENDRYENPAQLRFPLRRWAGGVHASSIGKLFPEGKEPLPQTV
jgi:hypothetical protein